MADRVRRSLALLLAASVCGCTSSEGTSKQTTAATSWTAAGVPAGTPRTTSSATGVVRQAPPASTSAPADPTPGIRPKWASGPGALAFPTLSSVNRHSVDTVAVDGARAFASTDTAVDRQPQDTAVRAALAGWLTPAYADAQLTANVADAPGAQWDTWTRHRAYVVVTARLSGDDHPSDTATVAARMVLLTERPVGRDGWRGKPINAVVAVVVKRVNGVWRIDSDQTS